MIATKARPYSYVAYCDSKAAADCSLDLGLIVCDEGEVDSMLAARGWVGSSGSRTCPACLIAPAEGPVWAYCGRRAVSRNSITGIRRHAVLTSTMLVGLDRPDAECGELGFVLVGEWDPSGTHNCPVCTAVLAGAPLPDRAPAPARPAPVAVPVRFDPPARCTPRPLRRRRVIIGDGQLDVTAA